MGSAAADVRELLAGSYSKNRAVSRRRHKNACRTGLQTTIAAALPLAARSVGAALVFGRSDHELLRPKTESFGGAGTPLQGRCALGPAAVDAPMICRGANRLRRECP